MSHHLYDEHYLVDESKDKKSMINIIRKGISPIPQEGRKCPVCGKYAQFYLLKDLHYADPNLMACQHTEDFIQKYPTFTCDECQTVWQYLGEKEEEKE